MKVVMIMFVSLLWTSLPGTTDINFNQQIKSNDPFQEASTPQEGVFAEPQLPGMGLGMFKPDFYHLKVLNFYHQPNKEELVNTPPVTDSLIFKKNETGYRISYAPPWFVPEILKMDDESLYLRVVTIKYDFLEVVVNESTGRKSWVSRKQGDFLYWPDFLLKMNSVEQLQPADNPVRIKPLPNASLVSTEYSFLKPVAIKQSWMEVQLLDNNFKKVGTGWIKWQGNGKLLINYSLFG